MGTAFPSEWPFPDLQKAARLRNVAKVSFKWIQTVESGSSVGGWDPVFRDHDNFSLPPVPIQGLDHRFKKKKMSARLSELTHFPEMGSASSVSSSTPHWSLFPDAAKPGLFPTHSLLRQMSPDVFTEGRARDFHLATRATVDGHGHVVRLENGRGNVLLLPKLWQVEPRVTPVSHTLL